MQKLVFENFITKNINMGYRCKHIILEIQHNIKKICSYRISMQNWFLKFLITFILWVGFNLSDQPVSLSPPPCYFLTRGSTVWETLWIVKSQFFSPKYLNHRNRIFPNFSKIFKFFENSKSKQFQGVPKKSYENCSLLLLFCEPSCQTVLLILLCIC